MRQRNQFVAFAQRDFIIVKRVRVGLNMAGRGDGMFSCRCIQRTIERLVNFLRQLLNGCGECLLDVLAITDERGLALRIHPPFKLHLTEHHVLVVDKILVNRNDFAVGAGVGNDFFPFDSFGGFTRTQFF